MKYHWDYVGYLVEKLADQIMSSGYNPTALVAIGRGGMIPTAMLAHKLGIKKVDYVGYSRKLGYWGDTIPSSTERVLFVDDIVETGGSFETVLALMSGRAFEEVRYAALSMREHCPIGIHFKGEINNDEEVPIMPWEKED